MDAPASHQRCPAEFESVHVFHMFRNMRSLWACKLFCLHVVQPRGGPVTCLGCFPPLCLLHAGKSSGPMKKERANRYTAGLYPNLVHLRHTSPGRRSRLSQHHRHWCLQRKEAACCGNQKTRTTAVSWRNPWREAPSPTLCSAVWAWSWRALKAATACSAKGPQRFSLRSAVNSALVKKKIFCTSQGTFIFFKLMWMTYLVIHRKRGWYK